MISEINYRFIDGKNQIDNFVISDAQNNRIEFRRSCPDIYVGTIPEIKHLKLVLLALIWSVRDKIKLSVPVIDIKFNSRAPSEGIITIYNQPTANVDEGNVIINEDIANRAMKIQEELITHDMAAQFNFVKLFRSFYVFDIGLLGNYKNGVFELIMTPITLDNQHLSFKMKIDLIFSRIYKKYIVIMIMLFCLFICQQYQTDIVNFFQNDNIVPQSFKFY